MRRSFALLAIILASCSDAACVHRADGSVDPLGTAEGIARKLCAVLDDVDAARDTSGGETPSPKADAGTSHLRTNLATLDGGSSDASEELVLFP